MSRSASSWPNDHDGLSAWERRVLAGIEGRAVGHLLPSGPHADGLLSRRDQVVPLVADAGPLLGSASSPARTRRLGVRTGVKTHVVIPWLLIGTTERRGTRRLVLVPATEGCEVLCSR